MQLGLKNRLRLISLLPIFILISITSYFAYNSYKNYKAAQVLQNRLSVNKELNNLLNNISRERGMTVLYLGNSSANIFRSLQKQRSIVDKKAKLYFQHVQDQSLLQNAFKKMYAVRKLVDKHKSNFKTVEKIYGNVEKIAIKQLEGIAHQQFDTKINNYAVAYLNFVNASENVAAERDFISFIITRDTKLNADETNRWFNLITRADALSYNLLKNDTLKSSLDKIFINKDTQELSKNINMARAGTMISAETGSKFQTNPGVWFVMLSEKINTISESENIILKAMDKRAVVVKTKALQFLSIALTIWLISIILAILSFLLSNEIAKNIQNLENVLKRAAEDTNESNIAENIDFNTAKGTEKAYNFLEKIIQQTKEDKEVAQEASEAKSMFLANMSHEIRTPLNGIVGFTELLKDTELKEEQQEFLEIIEKSSDNLLEIINNILDLSKIESNKLEIEDVIFNPLEEFESAVEVYAVRASEKQIDLGCFIDPALEEPLKGDPTKIKEVVINLLSNAVKFTSNSGAINVDIRKLESPQEGTTRIKFEVQDSGIGITSEQKSRIFESFSQADTSITRKYGGTGLGLTISARYIELMGGQLDLHSEPGEGTTFFFTLDFEEMEITQESSKEKYLGINALILESTHKTKRQDICLKEYLDFYGVSYTIFKDKNELETLQRQTGYDILFIDYEYTNEDELKTYSNLEQKMVLLTKSDFMNKIDSLGIEIFKIIYEPLNGTKLKAALENYQSQNFTAPTVKAPSQKFFTAGSSKFAAKVLIAEDNIINQKLIKRTLEDLGLSVDLASNGLEAFQKRKDYNYDLIFMDIQMPFLDGIEATHEILEYEKVYNQPHIPIIALTANALKGDRERFLKAGLDEYTTKPLVREEIITLLNHFLADHIVDVNEQGKEEQEEIIQQVVPSVVEIPEIQPTQDEQQKEEVVQQAPSVVEVPEIQPTQDEEQQDEEQQEKEEQQKEEVIQQEPSVVEIPEIQPAQEEQQKEEVVQQAPSVVEVPEIQPTQDEEQKEKEEEVVQQAPSVVAVPEIQSIQEQEQIVEENPAEYKADILLAKKSPFETKLFTKILDSLGYSYEVANNINDLQKRIEDDSYKLILFDKEYETLDLKDFAQLVKSNNDKRKLLSCLVLMVDPSMPENKEDLQYVDETIKNVINKDLLRLVIEKFI